MRKGSPNEEPSAGAVLLDIRAEDVLSPDEHVECVCSGPGVVFLGLSNGAVQAVAGPTHQPIFRFTCLRQRIVDLVYVAAREAVLSVEGGSGGSQEAVLYYFVGQGFRGAQKAQRLPVCGGSVAAVCVCPLQHRCCISAGHVVTLYRLLSPSHTSPPTVAPAPLLEIHAPHRVSCVSLFGDVAAYACGETREVWCVELPAGAAEVAAEAGPAAADALSSGVTPPELDSSFIEVRFRGPGGGDCADSAAAADTESQTSNRGFSLLRLFTGDADSAADTASAAPASPHSDVLLVQADGTAQAVPDGRPRTAAASLAGPVLMAEHRVLLLSPVGQPLPADPAPTCTLLLRHKLDAADGEPLLLRLLGTAVPGSHRVCTRLLTATPRRARLDDVGGCAQLADYVFREPAAQAACNSLHMFVAGHSGTVDVYTLRHSHPCDGMVTDEVEPERIQTRDVQGPVLGMHASDDVLAVCVRHVAGSSTPTPAASPGPSPTSSSAPRVHLSFASDGGLSQHSSHTSSLRLPRMSAGADRPARNTGGAHYVIVHRVAAPVQTLQELTRKAIRASMFSSEEAALPPPMHEALQLLYAHVLTLELLVGYAQPSSEMAALILNLKLHNAKAVHAAAATLTTSIRNRRRTRTSRRLDTDSRIEATSNKSCGSTMDAVSESHLSMPGSSYADSVMADELLWDRVANGSTVSAARPSASPDPDEFKNTWPLYAVSDRSLRYVFSTMKSPGAAAALISYFDSVLFSATQPPMLTGPQPGEQPVSEEAGNAILRLYAKHSPSRLCAVVWDSWLGRANGGASCFSAAVAAELLQRVGRRQCRGSLRKPSDAAATVSLHSLEESDCEDRDRADGGVQQWNLSTPREEFVVGLLLLEDGDVDGCVRCWSRVDCAALVSLICASKHLLDPDVRLHDGDGGGGRAEGQPTVCCLLAQHFPWALLRVLDVGRRKYGMSVRCATAILSKVRHKQQLLRAHFLCSVAAAPPPPAAATAGSSRTGGSSLRSEAGGAVERQLASLLWAEFSAAAAQAEALPAQEVPATPRDGDDAAAPAAAAAGSDVSSAGAAAAPAPPADDAAAWRSQSRARASPLQWFQGEVASNWPLLAGGADEAIAAHRPRWLRSLARRDFGAAAADTDADADLRSALTGDGREAVLAACRYCCAVLSGLLSSCPQLSEGLADAAAEAAALQPAAPGARTLAAVALLHSGRAEEAVDVVAGGLLPLSRLAAMCEARLGPCAESWAAVVSHARKSGPDRTHAVYSYAAGRLPLHEFLQLLPADGAARFFLPSLERAVRSHNAAAAKQRAAALLPD